MAAKVNILNRQGRRKEGGKSSDWWARRKFGSVQPRRGSRGCHLLHLFHTFRFFFLSLGSFAWNKGSRHLALSWVLKLQAMQWRLCLTACLRSFCRCAVYTLTTRYYLVWNLAHTASYKMYPYIASYETFIHPFLDGMGNSWGNKAP